MTSAAQVSRVGNASPAGVAWYGRPDVRAAAEATLALRLATTLYILLLRVFAGDRYAAGWHYALNPPNGVRIAKLHDLSQTGLAGALTTPWIHWDAVYFVRTATQGYALGNNTAFLPLYPLLIRVAGTLTGGHMILGALVVSTIATFFTFVLLYRLALRLAGSPQVAAWSVALAAALPLAFFLVAPYSEALFLACSLATILAALDARWGRAALFAALAGLTRQQGPLLGLLALPALWAALRPLWGQRTEEAGRLGLLCAWRAARGPLLLAVSGAAAYLLWLCALHYAFGQPTPYALLTSASGWNQHFTVPGLGVLADLAAVARDLSAAFTSATSLLLDAVAALLTLVGLAYARRRFPAALWIYLVACWCLAVAKVDAGGHTTSAARYLLELLPLLILPASWLARARLAWRVLVIGGCVALGLVFFTQWLLWAWVA